MVSLKTIAQFELNSEWSQTACWCEKWNFSTQAKQNIFISLSLLMVILGQKLKKGSNFGKLNSASVRVNQWGPDWNTNRISTVVLFFG